MQTGKTLACVSALVLAAARLEPPGGGPPQRPDGPPPYMPNPFVNEKCWKALTEKVGSPEFQQQVKDPKDLVRMCGAMDKALPQDCQDTDNKAVFECACAFIQDSEFMDLMMSDPSHMAKVAEEELGEKTRNQSYSCFYKQDSTNCAVSQAKGQSELKRCKASGDYYKVSRGLVSKYPTPWSVQGTAELCLPKKCVSLIPKFVKFVEEQVEAAKKGGGRAPPRGPMAPVTFVARRLAETHSEKIAMPTLPVAPLKPLALVAEPLRRQISSADQPAGAPPGMPFSDPKCPPPDLETDHAAQNSCSMDRKDCTDLEKKMVQCACGFRLDTDFVKAAKNMSALGEEVAKQIECLANNFATPNVCNSLTSPTIEEIKRCKEGGKKDWGYCVTGDGVVADFPGKWLTTRLSSMMGVCLPNACHDLLTGKELMVLLEKVMQAEKDKMMKMRQEMKDRMRRMKESAKQEMKDKKAACAKATTCPGAATLPNGRTVVCQRSGAAEECDVSKVEEENYNRNFADCSTFTSFMHCAADRCSWQVDSKTCADMPDDTAKENAEADQFLNNCKGGKCALPIKCGKNADQQFLDDVVKRTKRRVRTFMKIKNMNYDKLVANKALRAKFEKAIKIAIVKKCGNGVTEDHVVLALSKGSVNVDVTIIPDDDSAADTIANTVNSAAKEMSDEVVKDVKAVDGISEVEEGTISADPPSTAELEKGTSIEPVSPTGEPLTDSSNDGPSPSPGGGSWMMPLVVVLALVGAGGAAFFFFNNKNKGPSPQRNPGGTEMGRV